MPEETSPGAAREWVLLIHGTAAGDDADEGPRWWQRGSAFWQTLRDDLGPAFLCQPEGHVFHWSGANREEDRRAAGSALLARLRTLEAPVHLIGHSHGGSVIWHALVEATERGVELPHLASWTTVGTPFLHFAPLRFAPWALLPLAAAAVAGVLAWRHLGPWLAVRGHFEPGEAAALLGSWAVPLLWTVPLVFTLLALRRGVRWLVAATGARRQRRAARAAFLRFGDRYLGLWARDDEAASGLLSTLGFAGEITPRLALTQARGWRRLLALPAWPARWLYNRLAAELSDEFILDRIARRLQGNAARLVQLVAVTRGPSVELEGWPELPPELDAQLVAFANQHAAEALAGVRSALASSAAVGAELPGLFAGLRAQLTFRELIHNSYWEMPEIRALLAAQVLRKSAPRPDHAAPANTDATWLGEAEARLASLRAVEPPRPRWRTARLAAAGHLIAALLVITAALLERQTFELAVAPLAPDRQIEEVIRRAPAAGAVEMPWSLAGRALEGWIEALVRHGRTGDALALAASDLQPERRATVLALVTHALAESGQAGEASRVLAEALFLTSTWDLDDPVSEDRAEALELLLRELSHVGRGEEALARLEALATAHPDPAGRRRGALAVGLGWVEAGAIERALAWTKELSRADWGDPGWAPALVVAAILERERPEELALLGGFLASNPDTLDPTYKLGSDLFPVAIDLAAVLGRSQQTGPAQALFEAEMGPRERDRLVAAYLAEGGDWTLAERFLSGRQPPSSFREGALPLPLELTPDLAVGLARAGRAGEAASLLRAKGPAVLPASSERLSTEDRQRFGLFAAAWAQLGDAEEAVRLLPFADCNVESLAHDPACRRVLRILAERGQIPAARLALTRLEARDQPLYLALLGRAAFADDAPALLLEAAAQLPVMRSEESRSVVAGVLAAGWVRTGNYRRALDLADRCPTRTRLEVATLALEHFIASRRPYGSPGSEKKTE